MRTLFFFLAVLFCLPCYGAFPVYSKPVGSGGSVVGQAFATIATGQPVLPVEQLALKNDSRADANGSPGYGIAALACGVAGIFFPPTGILAIIFGVLGLKRRLRGLAIAGLVLGIVEALIFIFAIVAILIFLT